MDNRRIIYAFPTSGKSTMIDKLEQSKSRVFIDSDDLSTLIQRTTNSTYVNDEFFPIRLKSAILGAIDQGHTVLTNKLYKEFARPFTIMYIPTIEEAYRRAKLRREENPTYIVTKKYIAQQVKTWLKFAKKRKMKVIRLGRNEYLSDHLLT